MEVRTIYKRHPVWSWITVGSDGSIVKNGKFAKQSTRPDGYKAVSVGGRGFPVVRVHILVMETFVGRPGEGQETRHLNGVRGDNRLTNLAYGTRVENAADQKRHGTFSPPPRVGRPKGEQFSKLVKEAALEYINSKMSSREISRKYGVSKSHLLRKVRAIREEEQGHGS